MQGPEHTNGLGVHSLPESHQKCAEMHHGQPYFLLCKLSPLLIYVTLTWSPSPAPPIWTPWTWLIPWPRLGLLDAVPLTSPAQVLWNCNLPVPEKGGILCSWQMGAALLLLLPDTVIWLTVSNSVKYIIITHSQKWIFEWFVLTERSVKKQGMKILQDHAFYDFWVRLKWVKLSEIEIPLFTGCRDIEK